MIRSDACLGVSGLGAAAGALYGYAAWTLASVSGRLASEAGPTEHPLARETVIDPDRASPAIPSDR